MAFTRLIKSTPKVDFSSSILAKVLPVRKELNDRIELLQVVTESPASRHVDDEIQKRFLRWHSFRVFFPAFKNFFVGIDGFFREVLKELFSFIKRSKREETLAISLFCEYKASFAVLAVSDNPYVFDICYLQDLGGK